MSAYDNDPRVADLGHGNFDVPFTDRAGVTREGHVRINGWGTFTVSVPDPDVESQMFDTADEAIRSLIGDPQ